MAQPKYRPTLRDYETQHGIAKLERDGFNKEQIFKTMYKLTDGMPQPQRTDLVSKLYDRSES